jgi:D-glycero-D-manno-heptose 1,7-bisphosphate phosphatase
MPPAASFSLRPALFLDRDGTLIVDRHYLRDPAGVELLPGAADALRPFAAAGFLLFLFSNQSGVSRGLFTLKDVAACNQRLLDLLQLPPPGFTDICIAPEGPDDPPLYRKPSPRFIRESIERHRLDPARCWMIGDKLSDAQAGLNAGINAVLLTTAKSAEVPTDVLLCRDLKEFASRHFRRQLCPDS